MAVKAVYAGPRLAPPDWTGLVKGTLLHLGHEHGFKVCSSQPGSDDGEWLYDLVWYTTQGNGEEERLVDVPLVVECEWKIAPARIKEDFEKLLVTNAPLKLFVCCPYSTERAAWMDYFNKTVKGYQRQRAGECYLIAFIGNEEGAKPIIFKSIEAT